jgi:hypothetical protein
MYFKKGSKGGIKLILFAILIILGLFTPFVPYSAQIGIVISSIVISIVLLVIFFTTKP